MRNQPLLTAGVIGSVVVALINLLFAFGVPITPEQSQAIIGFVGVIAPIAVALIGRQFVYGPETVKRERRQRHGH
jgi:cadmium resistance protein CadD (predicted permease)